VWSAQQRGLAVRAAHGLGGVPDDRALDALLRAEGLGVHERCPFGGRLREVYLGGVLGIRAGQPAGWVRWLKCHGLGHHLLHRGNRLYAEGKLYLWRRQEAEAELFAGTVLLGDVGPLRGPGALAREARVPLACARSWQAALLLAHELDPAAGLGTPGPALVQRPAGSARPVGARTLSCPPAD
jgi:hypothetical protein